ncbi:MAG: hydrogenase maturation protease [Rhodothermus sp.]|nr:hydrogenase maturation protease [Rhodothermus sp.]
MRHPLFETARGPNVKVVIGLGHPLRGDDAAGPTTIAQLRSRLNDTVRMLTLADPLRLLDYWGDAELVIVCDAVYSGALPGTLHRFEAHTVPLPTPVRSAVSSHGIGLAEVVELARQLGRLPRRLIIYGIEGRWFEPGRPLSPEVAAAIPHAVEAILQELHDA